jgi:hypothetical protein
MQAASIKLLPMPSFMSSREAVAFAAMLLDAAASAR